MCEACSRKAPWMARTPTVMVRVVEEEEEEAVREMGVLFVRAAPVVTPMPAMMREGGLPTMVKG